MNMWRYVTRGFWAIVWIAACGSRLTDDEGDRPLPTSPPRAPSASPPKARSTGGAPGWMRASPDAVALPIRAVEASSGQASLAMDGDPTTAWVGESGHTSWSWSVLFDDPLQLGAIRVRWGHSPVDGVPLGFGWEMLPPSGTTCPRTDRSFQPLRDAYAEDAAGAAATRRTYFTDATVCGLRLVIHRTSGSAPSVREVTLVQAAANLLRDAKEWFADGARDDTHAPLAYETPWEGEAGLGTWVLGARLSRPTHIDRIRMVLGAKSVTRERSPVGRSYALAHAPVEAHVEVSEDGVHFDRIETLFASDLIRRRLVHLPGDRLLRTIRVVMKGATDEHGIVAAASYPVIRTFAAYAADDPHPVVEKPWLLSLNANPSPLSHKARGGELGNLAYHAKFVHARFRHWIPALAADDLYPRMLGPKGELLDAPPSPPRDGELLEVMQGDDPALRTELLVSSYPPPIVLLSGSNDWEYGAETGPDPKHPQRWRWNPLRPQSEGGIGGLSEVVKTRGVPLVGFCGGAQLLGLLEASAPSSRDAEWRRMDAILRRTTGELIRGFAPPTSVVRAWPGESFPRVRVDFGEDPLFRNLGERRFSYEFSESHADALRPGAFLGPLSRFEVLASSTLCRKEVIPLKPEDGGYWEGDKFCSIVPEVFRARDGDYPLVGMQFHPEQRDFAEADPHDPAHATADPRLLLQEIYESAVDALLMHAR